MGDFSYQWSIIGRPSAAPVARWRRRLGWHLRQFLLRLDRPQLDLTVFTTPGDMDKEMIREAAEHARSAFVTYLRDRVQDETMQVMEIENEWSERHA